MTSWPIFALFGGLAGVVFGVFALFAGLAFRRTGLWRFWLGLVSVSAVAVVVSINSSHWEIPDCRLPNGELDESRVECRMLS